MENRQFETAQAMPRTIEDIADPNGGILGPPRQRGRTIKIEPQDYGYLVQVGCQSLVFESWEKLVQKLMEYLGNPTATERKYLAGELL